MSWVEQPAMPTKYTALTHTTGQCLYEALLVNHIESRLRSICKIIDAILQMLQCFSR